MTNITIKNEQFTYPTLEELRKVRVDRPDLKSFGFPYIYEMIELLNNVESMENVNRKSHLHWWDHCLLNRIGSLNHAYTTALVHYSRGLPDNVKDYQHEHFVNRVQFGFYGETYFYFFISVRDTIAHLVNIFLKMNILEEKLYINKEFCSKIPDSTVKVLFERFLFDTKSASDFRNGLAHRFLITHDDYRPSIKHEKGGMVFEAGRGDAITSSQILNEVKLSMSRMAKFLDDLREIIKP